MDYAAGADMGDLEGLTLFEDACVPGHNLGGALGGTAPYSGYSHTCSEAVQCRGTPDVIKDRHGKFYAQAVGGSGGRGALPQGVDVDGKGRHTLGVQVESGDPVRGIARI